jgi:hypothetical protein
VHSGEIPFSNGTSGNPAAFARFVLVAGAFLIRKPTDEQRSALAVVGRRM